MCIKNNLRCHANEPCRAIHFALKTSANEVRICVWRSLDDAVQTFKELDPNLRSFITAEDIRVLPMPDWKDYYPKMFSYDEYAILWFAQVVYYSGTVIPSELEDCYDEARAVRHASNLLKNLKRLDENQVAEGLSKWGFSVRKILTGSFESFLDRAKSKPTAEGSFMPSPGPCRYCQKTPQWGET